jgi:EAL domain-containing protein (putative c-di-GMP-specific phosphodiesterase class I)
LQNFEFDKIKIDKRFIQSLESGVSNGAIVDAIIKLGIQIGIKTTAEGIETESQYDSVVLRGCSEGQGYLFSRPLTAEDALKAIARSIDA